MQDAFLDVARDLDAYLADPRLPLLLWLRLHVGRRLTTLHRQHLGTRMRDAGLEISLYHGALPEASSAALASMIMGRHTTPTQAAQRAERILRIQEALNSLDPIDREVLALRHFEQLGRAEAAHFRDSALRESNLASRERFANEQSQRDRQDAILARREAIEQRDRSRLLTSSLALEKGMALGEEGRADHGLLWMLEALKTAPEDAAAFRAAVRWNLGAWLGQVHRPLWISKGPEHCTHLAFSPDGSKFATGFDPVDRDRATPVVLWDSASGARRETLPGVLAPFAFRPDGRVLYAGAEPRGVLAIELATRRVLWTVPELPGGYNSLIGESTDGSVILVHRNTGGTPRSDWLVRLDPATGQPLGEPLELTGLSAVAPDGTAAAVVRVEDGGPRIALHEVSSGRRINSWRADGADSESNQWASRFSPDGRLLYSTTARGGGLFYQNEGRASRIWDALRGQPLSPILAATTYPIYTPAADRVLTLTNNLWLLRRAPDGQPRGSGYSTGGDGHPRRGRAVRARGR